MIKLDYMTEDELEERIIRVEERINYLIDIQHTEDYAEKEEDELWALRDELKQIEEELTGGPCGYRGNACGRCSDCLCTDY